MNKLIAVLKNRWGVTSGWSAFVILLTFSFAGFSTLYVHRYIDHLMGIEKENPFWQKLLVFVILVVPVFNIFLYVWGILFGQQKFITQFIKTKLKLISGGKLFKTI